MYTDSRIAALAAAQHGLITLAQCLEAGISARAAEGRVRRGTWRRVHASVFAVGAAPLSHQGRYLAAVLASGPAAALSHRSAASLWGLQPHHFGPVHVTMPQKRHSRAGTVIHWTRHPPMTVIRQGVRATSLARTLIDLADVATDAELEEAVRAAERLHRLDRATLVPILGRCGTPKLQRDRRLARGHLIRTFLRILDEAGFAPPETEARVLGYEVDAFWAEHRIVVEVDDYETHDNRDAMDADRARDRALTAAGIVVARVTHADLTSARRRLLGDLAALGIPQRVSG